MNKKRKIIALFFITMTILSLIKSNYVSNEFYKTINILLTTIIPSLLPFMILIQLLISFNGLDLIAFYLQKLSKKILNTSGYGLIVILCSIFGGFPYSAILTSELVEKKKLSLDEAKNLVKYIFFPSIGFLLSTLLNINKKYSYIIIIITISIYLSGIFLFFISNKKNNYKDIIKEDFNSSLNNDSSSILNNVINSSIKSIINICFTILLFSIFKSLISLYIKDKLLNLAAGIIEFSSSSINILLTNKNTLFDFIILTFIISFGGFCVFIQAANYIKKIRLSMKELIKSRLFCALLSVLLFVILFFIFL